MKMPALTKPKTAVTVSIIAITSFPPRARQDDCGLAQSKRFKAGKSDRTEVRFCRNTLSGSGTETPVIQREVWQPIIHHAVGLPISAAFALRYRHHRMRRWAASDDVAACGRYPEHAAGWKW